MRHVMLDIETMGTQPGSAVLQIGAVPFTETAVGTPFIVNVDLESSIEHGMTVDAKTVYWWMRQPDAARASVFAHGVPLTDALTRFADWLGEDAVVWGDGAVFDNCLLAAAYRFLRIKTPWSYVNDRCFRTIKQMFPVKPVRSALMHDAAADAVAQAEQMLAIVAAYSLKLQ